MPTSAGFASACPPSSDRGRPRSRGPRWWLRIGSGAHPAPAAQRSALPPSAGAHPGGRRSSGSNTSPPAAAAATSRFRHRPLRPSFGFEHGRRLRRRASPVRPGLGRFAAAGGRRATRPLATARPSRLGGRDPCLGARASQGRRLVTRCGSSTPQWGSFRTLNWTLNAESRPQRERRAAGRRPQNPAISRQNREVASPESNRGHHDFRQSQPRR
jgi:hypothetical protein